MRKAFNTLNSAILVMFLLLFVFALADIYFAGQSINLISGSFTPIDKTILFQLRLPHLFVLLLAGIGLGVAGAAIQGLLQNPLADPALLGISSGSSLCVVSSLVVPSLSLYFPMPLSAWLGSILAFILILLVAKMAKTLGVAAVILGGVALNALFGGAISLLYVVANQNALSQALMWTLGGVQLPSWSTGIASVIMTVIGLIILLPQARCLDALALGVENAQYMGVSWIRVRFWVLLGVSLLVSATVILAGPLAFVGLLVPHLARLIVGVRHRCLMPASALLGALLLLLADTVSRSLLYPMLIPLGVVLALIGAPAFLFILWRCVQRKKC